MEKTIDKIKEIRKYEERDIKITFKRVLAYFVIYSFLYILY